MLTMQPSVFSHRRLLTIDCDCCYMNQSCKPLNSAVGSTHYQIKKAEHSQREEAVLRRLQREYTTSIKLFLTVRELLQLVA